MAIWNINPVTTAMEENMASILASLNATINNFVSSTAEDFTVVTSTFKTGLPEDVDGINKVVLAALRIFSAGIMTAATILGFSAVNLSNLSQLTATFPTILAPAISAVLVFHDLYVGASAINDSLIAADTVATTTATGLSLGKVSGERTRGRRKPSKIRFRSGKTLKTVLNEGSASLATELTSRMWALKWVLVKTNHLWVPTVAKRFYDVSFPTVATETTTSTANPTAV